MTFITGSVPIATAAPAGMALQFDGSWAAGASAIDNHAPIFVSGAPNDGATGVPTSATLNVTASDTDLDDLTVKFFGRPKSPHFTVIALPDTQDYSASYPNIFFAQTNWIVTNKSTRNIVFVSHLGDLVDNAAEPAQWANARTAMDVLDSSGIPYGPIVGNHDGGPSNTGNFNANFGVSLFTGRPYYGGHYGPDNDNNYELFTAGGIDFIVVNLEYNDSPDPGVLAWADNLLQAYSSRRAIVNTHNLLSASNSFSTQANAIFEAIKSRPNLFLMMGGHLDTAGRRQDTGTNGNLVHSLRSDYQFLDDAQSGYLRILTFNPQSNEIQVETYSPNQNRYLTDSDNQFTLTYPMTQAAFQQVGTEQTINSGSGTATVTWSGLNSSTDYEWYATISDALETITVTTRSFTTQGMSDVAPVVTTQPANQIVTVGATATFTAAASGTPAPSVQWQVNAGSSWTDVPGATSTTLSFAAQLADNGKQYRAVFTNAAGIATTDAATLTVTTLAASLTLGNLTPVYDGTPKSVTVTTTPNGLSCTVTYNGSTIAPTNAGNYAVVATVTDPTYSGTATATLVIAKAGTTMGLTSSLNPSTFKQSVTFTATVTGPGTLSGTVTFKDGTTLLGTAIVPMNGVATYTTTTLAVGSHNLTAEYSGDSNRTASISPVVTQIVRSIAPGGGGNTLFLPFLPR